MKKQNEIKIFEDKKVRTIWDGEQEKWYFSVIDVIEILTNGNRPRKYWSDLKAKLKHEGSELSEKIGQLKMKAEDGKMRLTDIADTMIYSWMRNRNTLEFIGIWEELNNPAFKGNEFVTFKRQAGLNSFNLTPRKWIETTNAIGIISKAGRYAGGTYAHKEIDEILQLTEKLKAA